MNYLDGVSDFPTIRRILWGRAALIGMFPVMTNRRESGVPLLWRRKGWRTKGWTQIPTVQDKPRYSDSQLAPFERYFIFQSQPSVSLDPEVLLPCRFELHCHNDRILHVVVVRIAHLWTLSFAPSWKAAFRLPARSTDVANPREHPSGMNRLSIADCRCPLETFIFNYKSGQKNTGQFTPSSSAPNL